MKITNNKTLLYNSDNSSNLILTISNISGLIKLSLLLYWPINSYLFFSSENFISKVESLIISLIL